MKHYLFLNFPFIPAGTIKGFAPFDGTVRIQSEQSANGQQVFIMNETGWAFVFFHGDALVENGQKVTAGTPVVSWWSRNQAAFASSNGGTFENSSVDVALIDFMQNKFESPFEHFTPGVTALWKANGFTSEKVILSAADRDSKPCTVGSDGERFSGQAAMDEYVVASR
jgi:hypothetical protein